MKVITKEVRLSYVNLFQPRAGNEGQEPKYGCTLLIPKSDKETYSKLIAAQEDAIAKKWPSKRPAKIATTLHDGDDVRPSDGEPFAPECRGHWVMAVSSKAKPNVVDQALQPITDPARLVSGDYARVSINSYAYEVNGKRGVSFGLNNVQLLRKGTPLGSISRPEEDFEVVATAGEDFLD